MNIGFQKTMAVGPRGADGKQGEPGKDGTGTGTVTMVNGIEPDDTGDVILPIPPEPDLSGLATKVVLKAHEDRTDNSHKVTTQQVNHVNLISKKMSDPISSYPIGVSTGEVSPSEGWPNYGNAVTVRGNAVVGGTFQIYTPWSKTYGDKAKIRLGYQNGNTWDEFADIVTSKLPERINAVLAAGWTNLGGEYQPLTYYKDQFGVVHVNGAMNKGATAGHLATTLPVGIRPLKTNIFYSNFKDGFLSEIILKADGTLSIAGPLNVTHSVNISFRTD